MSDLWGVDDEKETERIRKAALRKAPKGWLFTWWILFVVVVIIWVELFNFPTGWPRTALMMMVGALIIVGQKRRAAKLFPEMLVAEGQCTKCGYDLKENISKTCPECGQNIDCSGPVHGV